MRLIGCITVFATTATAAAAAPPGAPPLPVPPVIHDRTGGDLVTHPRYYAFTGSGGAAFQDGMKMCMGGEALREAMAAAPTRPRDPKIQAAMTKCTHAYARRPDGTFSSEMTCDKAAGAPFNSHMTMSGTVGHWRQHVEMIVDDPAGGAPRTVVSDLGLTDLGDCPANVKPGQMMDRNGKVTDAMPGAAR